MRHVLVLAVALAALAAAQAAAADDGGPLGDVQAGSVAVSPATAVNAPVNVNAPVTVLGKSGDSAAVQKGNEAEAKSTATAVQVQAGDGGGCCARRCGGLPTVVRKCVRTVEDVLCL